MGRHPKVGSDFVSVTIKISKELYAKLQIVAIQDNISHVVLIEKLMEQYVLQHSGSRDAIVE